MTTAADDRANEDAFEALLAGRPAPLGAAGLAAFTGAVRGAAASPGRPSAALADLLSTGLLTDQSSPSARTAPTAGTTRSRGRTRRRTPVIVPALIAKFLSAGALAQAAAGAGVVVVVAAGAGTAGVLPPGAQTAFAKVTGGEVAEEDTGDTASTDEQVVASPDPGDPTGGEETAGIAVDGSDDLSEAAEAEAAWVLAAKSVDSQKAFKEWLAVGKAEGWVTGSVVREAAHARNAARDRARDAERAPEDTTHEAEDEAAEDEATEDEATEDEATEDEPGEQESDDPSDDGRGQAKGKSGDKGKNRD